VSPRALLLGGAILMLAACGSDDPLIVGIWKNGTGQQLRVAGDLDGLLTQAATCTPTLKVFVNRDPYDAYAIRFRNRQRVYYPPAMKAMFPGEYFCASPKSVPMCRFCRIEGDTMTCESPEQEIVGAGGGVIHDCNWKKLTAGTSTVPPASCGPQARDAACMVGTSTGT
jgi:hypothetical protein